MNLKLLLAIIPIVFFSNANAQEEAESDTVKAWQTNGRIGINFSNVSLSNWAGGGQESVSGTGIFLISANYKKGRAEWNNSLELAYGVIKQGDDPVIKSDDNILLSSAFNFKFKPKWAYSNVFTFRSQFAPGFNPPEIQEDSTKISDWLSPGYVQLATGVEYKPWDYLSFMFSPATFKMTIVTDQPLADAGAFGVEAAVFDSNGNKIRDGRNVRNEIGGSFRMNFKKEILKNVELESVLDLFSNYIENPDAIDVNWANNLNMKINDFMTASILTHLIYDDDIKIESENDPNDVSPRTQFKSVLGIGISYKF